MGLQGIEPQGFAMLIGELERSTGTLATAAGRLGQILSSAGLPANDAVVITQVAVWAALRLPDLKRRLAIIREMEAQAPDVFKDGRAHLFDDALFEQGGPRPLVGDFGDRFREQWRRSTDLGVNSGDPGTEGLKGVVEGTIGLGQTLWGVSQVRLLVDPQGWNRDMQGIAKGLVYGKDHPVEFAKAVVDWETWTTNPNRAFGKLVPDMLLAASTAGTGSTATAANRALKGLDATADLATTTRTAERAVKAWEPDVPRLEQRWGEHTSRWPEAERPVFDRSLDPPGSWRGDSGRFLGPAENARVSDGIKKIFDQEPKISSELRKVAADTGGTPVGWANRLKGEDRIKDKIAEVLERSPMANPERILARDVHDAIRYTLRFDHDDYVRGTKAAIQNLFVRGFEPAKIKNLWGDSDYKGVNTQWRDPATGQIFEVQFHTPISHQAKELTHDAYKRIRDPGTSEEELVELEAFQRKVSGEIPVPVGWRTIPDFAAGRGVPPLAPPVATMAGVTTVQETGRHG